MQIDLNEQTSLSKHYYNLINSTRIEAYEAVLKTKVKNKRVLHIGAGVGLFSLLAVQHGASKVIALEENPKLFKICTENIIRNELQNKINLYNKSILDLNSQHFGDQKFDFVIIDNLSTWQITSNQISLMNHFNNFLAEKDAICIPNEIQNFLELAQTPFEFHNLVKLRTYYQESDTIPSAKLLSEPVLINRVILNQFTPESNHIKLQIKANKNGLVNSIRLHSPILFSENASGTKLLPSVIFPLPKDIYVSEGDQVELSIHCASNSNWDEFKCQAKVLN